MPASLWLVPKDKHPFTTCVQELISDTVPSKFDATSKKHDDFTPHVTMTSNVDPATTYEKSSPQEWLDSLPLPEFKQEYDEVEIELDHLEPGDSYYTKLSIIASHDDNLSKLAAICHREGSQMSDADAQKWAKTEYTPHLSLLYADIPKDEIKKKAGLIELQLGFAFGSLFDCCGGTMHMGGNLVLVDTTKPIEEWKPIASRDTPWVLWRLSKSLV